MNKILKILLCVPFFACSQHLLAQQHEITLDSCKKAALDYNFDIKNSQLNYESAKSGKDAAKANRLPSVAVNGFMMYGLNDFIDPIPPLLDKGVNNLYFAGLSIVEPIYMGGKIKTGIELADLQIEINNIKNKQTEESVLLLTEQKYWRLVQLQEQLKVLSSNEIWLDELLKQTNDMLESGLIARNELLKIKVRKSELNLSKSKLRNNQKLTIFDFSLYTGIPYDSLLVAVDTLDNKKMPQELFVSPEQAMIDNHDILLLKQNVKAQQLQTKLARADYLPNISVGVNAGKSGMIGSGQLDNFMPMAFLSVSVPVSSLWWGSGKHKMKQQSINESIARNNLQEGQHQVQTEILRNWYDMVDAYQQIRYAQDNLEEATANLKVNQDNFLAGLVNITDLLDAQSSYQQACSSVVDAKASYSGKVASYLFIVGKLKSN